MGMGGIGGLDWDWDEGLRMWRGGLGVGDGGGRGDR